MMEADGRRPYAAIRFVNHAADTEPVLYPRPVYQRTVSASLVTGGLKYLVCFDVSGRKPEEQSFLTDTLDASVADLPEGLYFLVVSTGEKMVATRSLPVP